MFKVNNIDETFNAGIKFYPPPYITADLPVAFTTRWRRWDIIKQGGGTL